MNEQEFRARYGNVGPKGPRAQPISPATQPTPVQMSVASAEAEAAILLGQASGMASRLERSLGLGARPALRRGLFRRLEQLEQIHGRLVEQCVAEALMKCRGAREPGRYFCACVVRLLRSMGLVGEVPHGD